MERAVIVAVIITGMAAVIMVQQKKLQDVRKQRNNLKKDLGTLFRRHFELKKIADEQKRVIEILRKNTKEPKRLTVIGQEPVGNSDKLNLK